MNTKRLWVTALALLGCAVISASAIAADDHEEHHTSHGAHVHGEATLTLALEGSDVEIMLESPAANIIGFEYKAATEEEKRIEKQAADTLKSAGMFTFSGADCELEKVVVALPGVGSEAAHDEHGDHHDDHDSHHNEAPEKHSEVLANYHYHCEKLAELEQVSTGLFKAFPKLKKIEAMWVSGSGQGAVELSGEKSVMVLK